MPSRPKDTTSDAPETVYQLLQRAEDLVSGENPQLLVDVARKAYIRSKRLAYRRGEAYGLVFLGFGYWFMSEHGKSTQHLEQARDIFAELNDREGSMKALIPLLSVQKSVGTYDASLSNSLECLKFFRETDNRFWEGLTLLALGTLYYDLGDYAQSTRYCESVVSVAEELGKGWLAARGLVHLAAAHHAVGDYDRARPFLHRSLSAFRKEGNAMGEARALNDLGTTYARLGDDTQALSYHLEALGIREAIGQKQAQCTSLIHIGKVHLRRGELPEALEALERSLRIAESIRSKPRAYQSHLALSDAYDQMGHANSALQHYREFQRIKEEVFSDEQRAKLKNLQTQFEVERADQEMKIARLTNIELKKKNEQLEELLVELRGTQAQLVHAEKMASLGKLVAGIAHELNTPTGALRSASVVTTKCIRKLQSLVEQSENIDALRNDLSFQEAFRILQSDTTMMAAAAERVVGLARSLKNFARLDQAEFQRADIREGLDAALDLLSGEIAGRVTVTKDYGDIPPIGCYPAELNQLFLSLLTNASEAIDGAGRIEVRVIARDDAVEVRIEDSGRGIEKNKLDRLFEFDFQKTTERVKMGASLAIAHNIVLHHQGEIHVDSELGRGTTFTVRIPSGLTAPPSSG